MVNLDKPGFRRLDLGSREANIAKYGVPVPPDYDLKALKFPVASLSGSKDLLADPKGVAWTNEQLSETIVF